MRTKNQHMNKRGTYLLVNLNNKVLATFRLKLSAIQYMAENYSKSERMELRIVRKEE